MSEDDTSYVVVDDFFINWGEKFPVIHFPYHVQEILYELTLNYLIKQPTDCLEYCLDFLTQLKLSKRIDFTYDIWDGDRPSEVAGLRRNSVFAKSFDPQEDDDEAEEHPVYYPKPDEVAARLKKTLKNLLFFKNLDEPDLNRIVNAMFFKPVSKGEIVIQQGDDGDFFYVVQEGVFNAFKTQDENISDLCHYANKGHFGELALLYNQPRVASVVALTDGVLWALDRNTFQKIVLRSSYKRSRRYETMIDNVPILQALHPPERMKVADAMVLREYPSGHEIIRQGDAADGMYFIESGTALVLKKDKGKQDVLIKKLNEGDYFGELALLTLKPRACSVVAETDMKVAFLEVAAFERLLGPCMSIMKRNIEQYEQQIIDALGSKHDLAQLR